MRIISFIEKCQGDVIRKILTHRGLWEDPQDAERPPPRAGPNRVGLGDLFYVPDPDNVPFVDFPEDAPVGTDQSA